MRRWILTCTGIGMIILAGALFLYTGMVVRFEFDGWDKNGAVKQYDIALEDGGAWGEIIHEYEGADCAAHRWRYLGAYYIGHVGTECGGLVIERYRRSP